MGVGWIGCEGAGTLMGDPTCKFDGLIFRLEASSEATLIPRPAAIELSVSPARMVYVVGAGLTGGAGVTETDVFVGIEICEPTMRFLGFTSGFAASSSATVEPYLAAMKSSVSPD